MKSLTKRILTSVIALPILFVSAFLFPEYHHPLLMVIVLAAISFGTYEMAQMARKKGRVSPVIYLAPLLTLISYLERTFTDQDVFVFYLYIILVALTFSIEVFKGAKDDFQDSIDTVGRSVLILTYPALLSIFMMNILFMPNSSYHIALYFVFVFGEDTFAYFSGMLFGKNNRGVVKVSPKKSIAGFIGGILIPAVFGFFAAMLFPTIFTFSPLLGAFLGAITAVFGALGDLVESTFKRSADVKDSGFIVPGRGGILDSLDSLLFAAAPFSILITIFEML